MLIGKALVLAALSLGSLAVAEEGDLMAQGAKALAESRFEDAVTAYAAVVASEKRHTKAHLGLARAHWRLQQPQAGEAAAKAAARSAKYVSEALEAYALAIRNASLATGRKPLRRARGYFARARKHKNGAAHPELNLAMGLAWLANQDLEEAKPLLQKVLASDSQWVRHADDAYRRLQLIERAAAGGEDVNALAYQPTISRSEIAQLLVEDVGLPGILGKDIERATQGETSDQGLSDYEDHTLKVAILTAHRLGLRSLRIRNGKFSPDQALRRMDLALIIEDVLFVKDGISRTRFVGTPSPFTDLKPSHTAFNAVMTAVTRGLMEGSEEGLIGPNEEVSGAETVLVLRRLEKLLQ